MPKLTTKHDRLYVLWECGCEYRGKFKNTEAGMGITCKKHRRKVGVDELEYIKHTSERFIRTKEGHPNSYSKDV